MKKNQVTDDKSNIFPLYTILSLLHGCSTFYFKISDALYCNSVNSYHFKEFRNIFQNCFLVSNMYYVRTILLNIRNHFSIGTRSNFFAPGEKLTPPPSAPFNPWPFQGLNSVAFIDGKRERNWMSLLLPFVASYVTLLLMQDCKNISD